MTTTFTLASQFNKPTKMVKMISLSPLARIFQPFTNIDPYLDNPDLYKEPSKDPFDIIINSSWQTMKYKSGQVHVVDESLALAYVGIDNTRFARGTDYTGLVYFDVPERISIALDFHQKTGYELPDEIKADLQKHIKQYEDLSHKRVIDHAKRLYNSIVAGRAALREANKEPPEPNDMELLIAFILKDEVNKAKARRAHLHQAFDQAATDIGGDVNNLLG